MSASTQPTRPARPPYLAPQLERLGRWNWLVGCTLGGVVVVCGDGQNSLFDLERRK